MKNKKCAQEVRPGQGNNDPTHSVMPRSPVTPTHSPMPCDEKGEHNPELAYPTKLIRRAHAYPAPHDPLIASKHKGNSSDKK